MRCADNDRCCPGPGIGPKVADRKIHSWVEPLTRSPRTGSVIDYELETSRPLGWSNLPSEAFI